MGWSAEQAIFGVGRLHHLATPNRRQRVLSAALAVGIRAFDVAPAYGNGLGERELGRALRGRRDDVEIHSKVGIPVRIYPAISGRIFPVFRALDMLGGSHARCYQRRDFSDAHIRASVEASLRRLQTDRIDVLYLHEPVAPFEAAARANIIASLERLQREGKIVKFGVSGPIDSWCGPEGMPTSAVIQCPVTDASVGDAEQRLAGRELVFYGLFARYASSGSRQSFATFVDQLLERFPTARVIVASRDPERVAALRQR